jgi:hypothetical protein
LQLKSAAGQAELLKYFNQLFAVLCAAPAPTPDATTGPETETTPSASLPKLMKIIGHGKRDYVWLLADTERPFDPVK